MRLADVAGYPPPSPADHAAAAEYLIACRWLDEPALLALWPRFTPAAMGLIANMAIRWCEEQAAAQGLPFDHFVKGKYSEIVWLPTGRTASTSTNTDALTGLPNTYRQRLPGGDLTARRPPLIVTLTVRW